jgi:hypothetical protein
MILATVLPPAAWGQNIPDLVEFNFDGHKTRMSQAHNYREPWIYGKEAEKTMREMINQRYRLLPYIYSTAYEATQTGIPMSRTLAIDYSFDDQIYKSDFENEHLFGDAFLVAPVVSTQNFAKFTSRPAAGTGSHRENSTKEIRRLSWRPRSETCPFL